MAIDPLASTFTRELALVGVAAAAFALLARRLNLPTVVGFLVAGLLIGPATGLVRVGPALTALGEFGIALLLFLVGLDLSLREVRVVGPPAVVAGLGQILGSALGGYLIAQAFGFDRGTSLFLAVAFAFSSTVVVVKILVDLGDLDKTYGRLAVGIFLVQDLVLVLLLALIPVIGSGAGATPRALGWEAALAVARTLALAAGVYLAARHVLPPAFAFVAGSATALLFLGLAWLFVAIAASVALGVSVEVAAFAAGLSLATLPYSDELRRAVSPVLDLFIALFFVSLGVGFALGDALRLLPAALAFSAFVVVGKAVVLTLVLAKMGYPRETSFRVGVTVGQVSEFSFVLAAIAIAARLVPPETRSLVILVGMITIAASALLIWRSRDVYALIMRVPGFRSIPDGEREVEKADAPREGHVVILGWDTTGEAAARALLGRGERVLVVAAHPDVPDALPEGVEGLYADPQDARALESADIDAAKLVVANLREPGLVRVLLRRKRGGPPVIARAETTGVARLLEREGAAAVISSPHLVAASVLERLDAIDRARGTHG